MPISLAEFLAALCSIIRSRAELRFENLALRHQIVVLLAGMRERVNDLGGQFQIASNKDGTVIFVSVPLATDERDDFAA